MAWLPGEGLVAGQAVLVGSKRLFAGWLAGGGWVVAYVLVPGVDLLIFLARALMKVAGGGGVLAPDTQELLGRTILGAVVTGVGLVLGGGLALGGCLAAVGAFPLVGLRATGGLPVLGWGRLVALVGGGRLLAPVAVPSAGGFWPEELLGGGLLACPCCCEGRGPVVEPGGGGAPGPAACEPALAPGRAEVAEEPWGVLKRTWQPRASTCSCPTSVSRTVKGPIAGLTAVS
jgi:hypothetical protein